ncbi:MAG: toll/interleukin-1 receptor domain-containing protein [Candidatus Omnitrophica bacterium]|nr:toll/interleukin-1 receptor domain-containing protein [Candidatus Omnitrophota bacterium]
MPKAFLSHSSKDKGFVEFVAKQLHQINCIYDKETFEEGMKTFEEIEKGLGQSDVFVVFLSESSLTSGWVKAEMDKAYVAQGEGVLKRIYPIIIDSSVLHSDERIPLWMRTEYNLQYVGRPTVAARRITQRLREVSWEFHPRLKERENIFVGRNNLINLFEERVDDVDALIPVCFIAGGFKKIGRSSLLLHCLKKANLVSAYYRPPVIKLSSHESLEDFIYKIYDLGFSVRVDLTQLMHKQIKEKIEIALKLIRDLQGAKEVLFIQDDGGIVTPDRIICTWFTDILLEMKKDNIVTFAISSMFRMHKYKLHNLDHIFVVDVPELQKKERQGLLKRYVEFEELNLTTDDMNFIAGLLNGYPEQVFYSVDLIKDIGISEVKANSHLIIDFTIEKVAHVLTKYENNDMALKFLYLLSRFEFISYDLIFEIVGETTVYKELLRDFFASAVCEFLGANREYIRVNDAIKDYISRIRVALAPEHSEKLEEHHEMFLKKYKSEEIEISDFMYSMQTALLSGDKIDKDYVIPSHYLNAMIKQYNSKAYKEVVQLADAILQNVEYMDAYIEKEIRYFLGLSLARLRDPRFKTEVQKIEGPQHDFLFGFYYRLKGNNAKAIERLKLVLAQNTTLGNFAKRELVLAYIHSGEYGTALELSRYNYEQQKNNPYHIQAYFECLIRDYTIRDDKATDTKLLELLSNLEKTKTEIALEIYCNLKAQYLTFLKNDEDAAVQCINEGIGQKSDTLYLRLTKFDIFEHFNNVAGMAAVLEDLRKRTENSVYFYNSYLRKKIAYLIRTGDFLAAEDLIATKFYNFPEEVKIGLLKKINKAKHK